MSTAKGFSVDQTVNCEIIFSYQERFELTIAFTDGFFIASSTIGNAGENAESPEFVDFLGGGKDTELLQAENAPILKKLIQKIVTGKENKEKLMNKLCRQATEKQEAVRIVDENN